MRRLVIYAVSVTGLIVLAGCSDSSSSHFPNGYNSSYEHAGYSRSQPSQYGQLPATSESAGHTETVAGFPPGHPLHRDTSQETHSYDQQADEHPVRQNPAFQPGSPMDRSDDLPHTNFNY